MVARVEHGFRRYRKFRRNVYLEIDVGVHVGLEQDAWVVHVEPHLEGSGHRIDLRLDKINPGAKYPSWNGLDRYTGGLAQADVWGFILEHIRHDPDVTKIHDRVQVRVGHNFQLRERLAIGDISRHWRVQGDVLDRLAGPQDLVDLR